MALKERVELVLPLIRAQTRQWDRVKPPYSPQFKHRYGSWGLQRARHRVY